MSTFPLTSGRLRANLCQPRIPFYAWLRLGFLLYLILPQTQGARVIYQEHVHPFLRENELAIDDFISTSHDRIKAAGLTYLRHIIELLKQNVLGIPPKETPPPSPPSAYSYTQNLMARFNLPAVRPTNPVVTGGSASTANDFYSLLASAVTAATGAGSNMNQARDLSNSGTLIPPSVHGEERLSFITAQRERLSILLSALDKEASNLQGQQNIPKIHTRVPSNLFDGSSGSDNDVSVVSGLSTRKSEVDFENIEAESGAEENENGDRPPLKRGQSASGSWMPWSWGAKAPEEVDTTMEGTSTDVGKSSGVDAH